MVGIDTDCSAVYWRGGGAVQQRGDLNAVNKKLEEGIILSHVVGGKMRRKFPPLALKLNPSFTANTKQTIVQAFLANG